MTPRAATALLTACAMVAFAANSLLCRLALSRTAIDPAGFTCIRLLSGALLLGVASGIHRGRVRAEHGSFASALMLFVYAAAFSFAYVRIGAGVGALFLFGAVQVCMIGVGVRRGERLGRGGSAGLVLAIVGLVGLVAPGASAPDPIGAALMTAAGIAWGAYSLLGRGATDPFAATTGNFVRAAPMGLALVVVRGGAVMPVDGVVLAILSGALASAGGYVLWNAVLPRLRATEASIVQLSVPVLAAALGVVVLGEPPTARLGAAGVAILAGVALALRSPRTRAPSHGR